MQRPDPGERLRHLKGHFAIKDLEVLVGNKLTVTQQCTVTGKRANNLWIGKCCQQAQDSDPSHLLSPNKTHQERCVQVWVL